MLRRIYHAVSVTALGLALIVALLVILDHTFPEVYTTGEPPAPLAVTVAPGDTPPNSQEIHPESTQGSG